VASPADMAKSVGKPLLSITNVLTVGLMAIDAVVKVPKTPRACPRLWTGASSATNVVAPV